MLSLGSVMSKIRSKAGHVLATSDDPEARSLAAYVLGDEDPARTSKTKPELEALLAKVYGMEGQSERAALIRQQLEAM